MLPKTSRRVINQSTNNPTNKQTDRQTDKQTLEILMKVNLVTELDKHCGGYK